MAKTIALCNQKGGVGKTTTAVNVGAFLALQGVRVLLVDLDPQANATGGFGIDKRSLTRSVYQVLMDGEPADSAILPTQIEKLKILPSQVALSGAELELMGLPERENRLKQTLTPLQEAYEVILIDCPPSLGLLTINALTAAEGILIPLQCEYYALEGLSQLLETVKLLQRGLNPRLKIEGILFTMSDLRTKLTNDVIREVRQHFGPYVFDVIIPRSVRLSEAPSHGLPIALYDPHSAGAQAYQQLAQHLKEGIHAADPRTGQGDQGSDTAGEPSTQTRGGDQGSPQSDQARSISTPAELG